VNGLLVVTILKIVKGVQAFCASIVNVLVDKSTLELTVG